MGGKSWRATSGSRQNGLARGLGGIESRRVWHRIFRIPRHSKGELPASASGLSRGKVLHRVDLRLERADGTRRFRTVYQELPKKNGKSTLCAGVGLFGLIADNEPGAEVYATATKRDQARIVLGEARRLRFAELRRKIQVFTLNCRSIDGRNSSRYRATKSRRTGSTLHMSSSTSCIGTRTRRFGI